jgi:hypothetical protein
LVWSYGSGLAFGVTAWTFGFDLFWANQNMPRNGAISPNLNSKLIIITWLMLLSPGLVLEGLGFGFWGVSNRHFSVLIPLLGQLFHFTIR